MPGSTLSGAMSFQDRMEVLQVWRLELISLADAPRILSLRSFQMAAIRAGSHPPGGGLVFALFTGSRSFGANARAGGAGREMMRGATAPQYDYAVGPGVGGIHLEPRNVKVLAACGFTLVFFLVVNVF